MIITPIEQTPEQLQAWIDFWAQEAKKLNARRELLYIYPQAQ